MPSSSFRSGNCSRPGFFDPSSSSLSRRRVRGVGVPLGVPPPYDGSERAQATSERAASEGGCGVGVPPPYDGTFGSGSGGVSGGVSGGGSGSSCRRRHHHHHHHHELIAQMHGREISFTHTVFVVVAMLLFCVYFVAFIDRMRLNAINATATR